MLYVLDQNLPGFTVVNGSNWAYTFPVCTGSYTYAYAGLYDSVNNELYVACYGNSGYVAVVNPNAYSVIKMISVPYPLVLGFDPANFDIYVGSDNPNGLNPISVISGVTNKVIATIPGSYNGPNIPNQIIYNSANKEIYVTNNNAPNYLTVINAANNKFITNIQIGPVGGGAAGGEIFDPTNGDVYVLAPTQGGNTPVDVVNASNQIVAQITPGCGGGTDELLFAYNSANGNIYCGRIYQSGGTAHNQVCEISSSTNVYVGCVNTSAGNSGGIYGQSWLLYDPANQNIYVAGGGPYSSSPPQTIEVVSSSLALLKTLGISGVPFQLTFNPANNEVYAGVPQTGSPQFNIVVPVSS